MKLILLAITVHVAVGQGAGNGISKTTYSANEALTGLDFMLKYLPVAEADDSCPGDVCSCTVNDQDYLVQQGRVALESSTADQSKGTRGLSEVSSGFGLHLVNCSTNSLGGGMTTAQVEAEFTSKFGDMSKYDQFMDYNAALLTTDLDYYAGAFDADRIAYLPIEWTDQGTPYYGIIVHVPSSQMVLEIMARNSSSTTTVSRHRSLVRSAESRAPASALKRAEAELALSGVGMAALVVNRAASDLAMIEEFYSTGMHATTTYSVENASGVSKRCYLWTGASVDVCFTQRDKSNATSTDFSVKNFEDMLNAAHYTVVTGGETCNNKWMDNHYAIDAFGDFDYIISYIEATPGTFYYCQGSSLHYVVDPTGWGIQLDLQFSSTGGLCLGDSSSTRRLLQGPPPPPPGSDDAAGFCPCTGMTVCGVTE